MDTPDRSARVTVDLRDPDLYRRLRYAAIDQRTSVREVITEAVTEWLARHGEPPAQSGHGPQ